MKKSVFVIEDEKDMLEYYRYILTEEGYEAECFSCGEIALQKIKSNIPDLILLDLMLVKISGLELCRILKSDPKFWDIPIIVISSRSDEFDIVNGINIGCDDYITKPFSEKILLAKIKSILDKKDKLSLDKNEAIKFKDIILDSARFEVSIKGKIINLTPSEFKVLNLLLANKGIVFTRDQICAKIYDYDGYYGDRSVDILIGRIRKKIGSYGKHLESIYGVGYRFKEEINE